MTSEVSVSSLSAGWRRVRLADLAEDEEAFADGPFGSNLKTEHYSSEGARVIRLQNIGRGVFLDADKAFVPLEHFASLRRHSVKPGDVVVAALGDGARPAGRACVVPSGLGPAIVKADCFRIRLPRALVLSAFLAGFLNSPQSLNRVAELMRGATRPRVTLEILKRLEVCLPTVAEQTRIALALQEMTQWVEQARADAEARLETVSTLIASYTRSAYGGPTTRLWPRQRLAQCADIVGGIQKTPDRAPHRNSVPYLTVRNVQRGWLDLTHVEKFEVTADEVARLRLTHGDILIVEGNGSADQIGRNALFSARDEDWIHQNHVIRVRLRQEMALPDFVSGFLNSAAGRVQMLEKARTTSGLYSLSVGKVGELEVPLPSIAEQQALSDALRARTSVAALARQAAEGEIGAINALPASLLRRVFGGGL